MNRPSDLAFSTLHAAGGSAGDVTFTDPATGRLVWMVYAHRDEQQVIAKAESQAAAWAEAARLATVIADGRASHDDR